MLITLLLVAETCRMSTGEAPGETQSNQFALVIQYLHYKIHLNLISYVNCKIKSHFIIYCAQQFMSRNKRTENHYEPLSYDDIQSNGWCVFPAFMPTFRPESIFTMGWTILQPVGAGHNICMHDVGAFGEVFSDGNATERKNINKSKFRRDI